MGFRVYRAGAFEAPRQKGRGTLLVCLRREHVRAERYTYHARVLEKEISLKSVSEHAFDF